MIYNFPSAINFGWGEAEKIGKYIKGIAEDKVLLVTDKGVEKAGLLERIRVSMEDESVSFAVYDGVQPNPTDHNVVQGLKLYREENCGVIVAVGGGSPMDAAKGIMVLVSHPGSLHEYYSGAEDRRSITANVPPFIAVPTTSGTGSEVSRGAIITDTKENRKRSVGSRYLLPSLVILDPSLTLTMPPKLTAHTGLDALSHNVEALAVDRYAPIADAFAREGIRLVAESLIKAYDYGEARQARQDMMMASTLGAMAFSKGLGVIHSLAHQLSPQIGIPHGAACGIMLPHAMRFNLEEGPAAGIVAKKYAEVAGIFGVQTEGMNVKEIAEEAANVVQKLLIRLNVPTKLKHWSVRDEDIQIMAKNAMLDHCHYRNPRPCTEETMDQLFKIAQ